jgi:hypothetical protein
VVAGSPCPVVAPGMFPRRKARICKGDPQRMSGGIVPRVARGETARGPTSSATFMVSLAVTSNPNPIPSRVELGRTLTLIGAGMPEPHWALNAAGKPACPPPRGGSGVRRDQGWACVRFQAWEKWAQDSWRLLDNTARQRGMRGEAAPGGGPSQRQQAGEDGEDERPPGMEAALCSLRRGPMTSPRSIPATASSS